MSEIKTGDGVAYIIKCAICNDEICGDSQFINNKWYHNKCIVKQLQEIERLNNIIKEVNDGLSTILEINEKYEMEDTDSLYSKKWLRETIQELKEILDKGE